MTKKGQLASLTCRSTEHKIMLAHNKKEKKETENITTIINLSCKVYA